MQYNTIRIEYACKTHAIEIQRQCDYIALTEILRYERITDARRVPLYYKAKGTPMQYIGHTNAILRQHGYNHTTKRKKGGKNINSTRIYCDDKNTVLMHQWYKLETIRKQYEKTAIPLLVQVDDNTSALARQYEYKTKTIPIQPIQAQDTTKIILITNTIRKQTS